MRLHAANSHWKLPLALVLSVAVAGCGGGATGYTPPIAPFPAPVGATWTYKVTQTPPGGLPITSTLTLVYKGVTTYRGSSYHLFEDTNSSSPGFTERIFTVWDGSLARIKAELSTDGINTIEFVFDKTWVLNQAAESQSGMVQRYVNGILLDSIPWSVSTSNGGTAIVTVPAGTFTTTKWDGTLNVGGAQPYSSYTSAHTEIKRQFTSIVTLSQVLFELTSGGALSVTSQAVAETTAAAVLLKFDDLKRQLGTP